MRSICNPLIITGNWQTTFKQFKVVQQQEEVVQPEVVQLLRSLWIFIALLLIHVNDNTEYLWYV